jgi:dTDP-glucose 4,6-dehydratase
MKNLLITGGAGFIGSNFVTLAIAKGKNVIILDALTYAGSRDNLSHLPDDKYKLIVGNINNQELVCEILTKYNIDAIVNFAAESHVDNSINSPAAFIETNIVGTYKLLEAARHYYNKLPENKKSVFRFLHISTDEVYGELGGTGKFSEASKMQPNSPYSASKAASDHLVRAWCETYKLPTITTNCSNNYGPRQHSEKLIPLMINNALQGKKLPIYGNGSNIRDWIFVEDHCEGVFLALEKGKIGETYCFGGNSEKTNLEVVKEICAILDKVKPKSDQTSYNNQIEFVTDRLGHDYRYAIDDSKAVKELGFTRKYNFADGIRETIDCYMSKTTL